MSSLAQDQQAPPQEDSAKQAAVVDPVSALEKSCMPIPSECPSSVPGDGTSLAARKMSATRRYALLLLFCLAQFIGMSYPSFLAIL